VIHEIDEAIESLVKNEVLDGSGAEVVFDAPTKDWASRRNTPTIDVYLYDIREDPSRRQVGSLRKRNDEGLVVSMEEPPRFFRLSYLVTAWTQRPEDEHRLLSAMLYAFLRHKILPEEHRSGSLRESLFPILIEVAKPPAEQRQISEVWSALGGELKASLDLVVTAAIGSEPVTVFPPAPEQLRVHASGTGGQEEERRLHRPEVGPSGSNGSGADESVQAEGAPKRARRGAPAGGKS
jgi:hypothetical protein